MVTFVRSRGWLVTLFLATMWSWVVYGQGASPVGQGSYSGLDVQHFLFAPGPKDGVMATSPLVPGHLQVGGGIMLHYARRPLVFRYQDSGDLFDSIVEDRFQADLYLSLGLADRLELSVALPVSLYQDGSGPYPNAPGSLDQAGVGDVRFRLKMLLMDLEAQGVALGFLLESSLPTGNTEGFMGGDVATWTPQLLLEHHVGAYRGFVNVGYRLRDATRFHNLNLDDELVYRAGVALNLVPDELDAHVELFGATAADAPFDDADRSPLEGILAGRYFVWSDLALTFGFGVGLVDGYGTPEYRVFSGLAWAPRAADRDGDGILDRDDRCPTEPEDLDGFQDTDGCPDPDNDGDGILDKDDKCPDEAEDVDGFQDADGCPDPDNDKDGILDKDDKCPNDAEDMDGFQDTDGCPDPDNDGDKILDKDDKCPNEAEVYNGHEDEDGCPDQGKVIIKKGKLKIMEKIYFEFNKAVIKPVSYPILKEVAAFLKANPQIALVRVEGHTDSVGDAAYNLKLSQARATAVMRFLVEAGVEPTRLVAQGFGEDRPIDSNETPEGRAQNRRVEFVIVEEK